MKHTVQGLQLTNVVLEIFKLNGLLVSSGDELIKELGLTSARWKVLGALSYKKENMTVSEIARMMGQSRQAVQRLANEMIEDKLLELLPNPRHQKAKLLKLTQKGIDIYHQAMQKQIPWINMMAQEVEKEDLEVVAVTLEKLNNYLATKITLSL